MTPKTYSVVGNKKNGHRIAVPECVGAKAGDKYEFEYFDEGCMKHFPKGTLVFIEAVK